MKTSTDPRHQKRIRLMQQLFADSFTADENAATNRLVHAHLTTIDEKIQKAAPEWPIGKIAKIDLAILRLAVFELTVAASQPPKVIIDEAVELAKEYGNENSPKFVNGVLGTILKEYKPKEEL